MTLTEQVVQAVAPLNQYRYLIDIQRAKFAASESFGCQSLAEAQRFVQRNGHHDWTIREWDGERFCLHSES